MKKVYFLHVVFGGVKHYLDLLTEEKNCIHWKWVLLKKNSISSIQVSFYTLKCKDSV